MKKSIFVVIVLIFISLKIFSQTTTAVKFGLNLNKVYYLDPVKQKTMKPIMQIKPGFSAGFSLHHELNLALAVQADVIYTQKGLKYKQVPYSEGKKTMNYVEIPISGQVNIVPKDKVKYMYVYIGGYGAFWTDGRTKILSYKTGNEFNEAVEFQSENHKYSRFDAGVIGGFTYRKYKTVLDIRYTHSMLSSSEMTADAVSNRLITMSVSYVFYKIKK